MAAVGKANALPVIIVGLAVCGLPAYALATLFGAGSVAMIAMMVSLFTFISIIGGSLPSDVKTAAVVTPLAGRSSCARTAARSVGLAKSIVGMFFLTTTLLVSFGDDGAFRVMMESAVGAICMSAVVAIAAIMLHRSRSGGPLAGGEN